MPGGITATNKIEKYANEIIILIYANIDPRPTAAGLFGVSEHHFWLRLLQLGKITPH